MIISELTGFTSGFEFDGKNLYVLADLYPGPMPDECINVKLAFNRNRPESLDLSEFDRRKIRVTVELIDTKL